MEIFAGTQNEITWRCVLYAYYSKTELHAEGLNSMQTLAVSSLPTATEYTSYLRRYNWAWTCEVKAIRSYWTSLEGWVDLGIGHIPRWFTCQQTVTHPGNALYGACSKKKLHGLILTKHLRSSHIWSVGWKNHTTVKFVMLGKRGKQYGTKLHNSQ